MLEGTEDEQYERRWEPVFEGMGNAALKDEYTEEYWATAKRDSDKESVFVLLIVPGGVMEHSMLLTYTSGLGNTVLFKTSEDAFNHGSHYIDDPWQVVKL
jgi:hypothetical protein